MATLEDKILGEKREYYCSSSEEEVEEEENDSSESNKPQEVKSKSQFDSRTSSSDFSEWEGVSMNTGPKGVIRDWEMFNEMKEQKRLEYEKSHQIIKSNVTCHSLLGDELSSGKDNDADLMELFSDEFLLEYQKKKMKEMLEKMEKLRFGSLIQLNNTDEFLKAIDDEEKFVTVIIHIYENGTPGSDAMNGCLLTLAQEYPFVKFCKILASAVDVSERFRNEATPAIIAYKSGSIIGNFIHITDILGEDFYASDVETFLLEHGLINDRKNKPAIIVQDNTMMSNSE